MNTLIPSLALALVALAAVPAHAPARPPATLAVDSSNTVTVQNDRTVPVTVYMDYGEFDRRLGTVPPLQAATLPLPEWAVRGRDRIRLFVHPEGSMIDLASRGFTLRPPTRLELMVPRRGGTPPAPGDTMMAVIPPDELADATLTVDNGRSTQVTVYAEDGDFDVRLGLVPAHGRATLRFPRSVVGPDQSLQVFVHPEGGFDLATETLQAGRGQHLGLRVPAR